MAADPPSDPFAPLLGYQLRRLSLAVMADLAEGLQPLRLRPAEATVLLRIAANPGITQSEVGRLLAIKRANMAPLIAGLEARGLLCRAPVDGRSQALTLTDAGAALARDAYAEMEANEARCFPTLPAEGRLRLAEQLRGAWSRLDRAE